MERAANRCARRLAWLLLGLMLAAVPWCWLGRGRVAPTDHAPAQGTGADSAAAFPSWEKLCQPRFLEPLAAARPLPVPQPEAAPVVVTGFPAASADTEPQPPWGRLRLSDSVAPEMSPPAVALAQPAEPLAHSSPLPLADSLVPRSAQLETIAQQADRQIRQGFEMAGRGALFAARAEFIAALRLLAQGLDAEQGTSAHSRALAAGLTALKEAEDFVPEGGRLEADLDLAGIIGSHCTPVLKQAAPNCLTPLGALKCYFTFAQEQLGAAVGRELSGSMALCALGKLHGTSARQKGVSFRAAEPKAIVFYQAALLVYPNNFMAANDLGVLLARYGNCAQARAALEHSLEIHQHSVGWHNLAVVYQQMGQGDLAQRAGAIAEAVRRAEAARAGASVPPAEQIVRWIDPASFAGSAREPSEPRPPKAAPAPAAPAGSGQPQAQLRPANAPPPAQAPRPRVARRPEPANGPPAGAVLPWFATPERN